MRARLITIAGLVALLALSACASVQYREGAGHRCRDESRCPYGVS